VSETLIRELDTLETSWPMLNGGDARNELNILLFAMNALSIKFPFMSKFWRLCCEDY
jgi:hypothetical protein